MGRDLSRKEIWAIASLAAYDLWLLAFPLQGYFLLQAGVRSCFACFVIPHTAGLFLSAVIGHRLNFERLSLAAGTGVSILTAIFPFFPSMHPLLFAIIGLLSSLLIVRIGCLLSAGKNPTWSSALGLALGNVLLGVILIANPPKNLLFPFIAILLLAHIPGQFPEQRPEPLEDLKWFLPFIFGFYLFTGTFYVCLMPYYIKFHYANGLELIFYIGALFASAKLFEKRPDYSLVIGAGISMFAAALLHSFNRLTSNLAMFAVQAAAGFVDVFCFGLFTNSRDTVRRFGIGAGCMLAGPMVGLPLLHSPRWAKVIGVAGNVLLGLMLVAFHITQSLKGSFGLQLPEEVKALLSEREQEILRFVVEGKTIKETAKLLSISESTVKTYLQRIYSKLNVKSKRELMVRLGRGKRP